MRKRPAPTEPRLLLLALACLCAAAAPAGRTQAQGWPAAGPPNSDTHATRKVDEYGKIGHCDETARLDYFATELRNEPGSKGYLLVYVGKDDLLSWTPGILGRAASYLVDTRRLDASRVQVINGGYREERTIELWLGPENGAPPQPSDTVDFKLDRTKAYQWDENRFNIGFIPDDTEPAEPEEAADSEEAAASEEAEGEAAAAAPQASAADAESEEEAAWRKQVEKYNIEVVARGVIEDEPRPEEPDAGKKEAAEGAAEDAPPGGEAAAEPEEPPTVGEIEISLWWNVEKLADELKAVPDARVCLVYYWGVQNATQERAREVVERAVVKTQEQLGLKRDRIIVIDGGRSYEPGVELWVVPAGAQPPRPRPEQKRKFGFYSMPGE